MKKINTNFVVRESIAKSLIELMKVKNFEDINIKELTTKAGVGRVSFYRNFDSKEDIIMQYFKEKIEEMNEKIEKDPNPDFAIYIFNLFYEDKNVILLMYKNNLSYLFERAIKENFGPKDTKSNSESYMLAFIQGAIYGMIEEWINRGMSETPKQMSEVLSDLRDRLDIKPY